MSALVVSRHAVYRMVQRGLAPSEQAAEVILAEIAEKGVLREGKVFWGGMVGVIREDTLVTVYSDRSKRMMAQFPNRCGGGKRAQENRYVRKRARHFSYQERVA